MADIRTQKKSLLREAACDGRSTAAQQLAWLEQQRREMEQLLKQLDWEITGQNRNGRSNTAVRRITATERQKAIIAAIEHLEAAEGIGDTGGGGEMLTFRVHGIQS